MTERPECDEHGTEFMIHEDQQQQDYWICTKCEAEDDPEEMSDFQLVESIHEAPEALNEEVDTMGVVELRKIIEIALERTGDPT